MLTILRRRGKSAAVPPVETAERFVDRRTRGMPPGTGLGKRFVIGEPAAIRDELEQLAAGYGVDELLIVNVTHDHEARRRSYALLADAFSLRSGLRLADDERGLRGDARQRRPRSPQRRR